MEPVTLALLLPLLPEVIRLVVNLLNILTQQMSDEDRAKYRKAAADALKELMETP